MTQSPDAEPDDDALEDAIDGECTLVKLENGVFVKLNPQTALWEDVETC